MHISAWWCFTSLCLKFWFDAKSLIKTVSLGILRDLPCVHFGSAKHMVSQHEGTKKRSRLRTASKMQAAICLFHNFYAPTSFQTAFSQKSASRSRQKHIFEKRLWTLSTNKITFLTSGRLLNPHFLFTIARSCLSASEFGAEVGQKKNTKFAKSIGFMCIFCKRIRSGRHDGEFGTENGPPGPKHTSPIQFETI